MTADKPENSPLSITDTPVPVFDCHVLLTHGDSGVSARAANLDGVAATGPTERDALRAIVKVFKQTVEDHVRKREAIPFRAEPHKPEANEVERWVPVHL